MIKKKDNLIALIALFSSCIAVTYLLQDKTFYKELNTLLSNINNTSSEKMKSKILRIQNLGIEDKKILQTINAIYSSIPNGFKNRLSSFKLINQSADEATFKNIEKIAALSEVEIHRDGDLTFNIEIVDHDEQIYILGSGETNLKRNRLFESSGQYPKRNPDLH